MNTTTEPTKAGEPSLTKDIIDLVRYYLSGRRGLIVLAVVILSVAAFFNWGWLVAAGVAPLLLALAPCAAMCALGLCMNKKGGKSCSTESGSGDQGAKTNPSSTVISAKTSDES